MGSRRRRRREGCVEVLYILNIAFLWEQDIYLYEMRSTNSPLQTMQRAVDVADISAVSQSAIGELANMPCTQLQQHQHS